jgi:hypothetical protein
VHWIGCAIEEGVLGRMKYTSFVNCLPVPLFVTASPAHFFLEPGFGAMRWGSGVEVPAKDKEFYAVKNVPHGQLREVLFYSASTESTRRAFVYTPQARCEMDDRNEESKSSV